VNHDLLHLKMYIILLYRKRNMKKYKDNR